MRKLFLLLTIVLLDSCATPPVPEMTPVERRQRDNAVGLDLAQKFETRIHFKRDSVIVAYLEEMGRNLSQNSPELKQFPLEVRLITSSGPKGDWRNYALPGNRIYVSTSFLKDVRFENEVAAILALELGHILKRTAVSRLKDLPGVTDFFGTDGIFAFTDEQHLEALVPAMEMLYSAGFDPRGMVSLITRYQENPGRSPYTQPSLAKMLENTRRIIALHAPLRNPIVRSERFLALRKRMQAL